MCPYNSGKKFSGNFYVKFGHFSGKNHVKLDKFVNFSANIIKKIGYFDNFSGKNHVKFWHFVNFSYIFFGQKCRAPLKLTELLRLCSFIKFSHTFLGPLPRKFGSKNIEISAISRLNRECLPHTETALQTPISSTHIHTLIS